MFQRKAFDKLRLIMDKKGVDACIITGGDPHNSEYPPEYWMTREIYSGFSGSAGCLVILKEKTALWTDSRYWLQAAEEMKESGTLLMKIGLAETPEPAEWIAHELGSGSLVAIDGRTLALKQGRQWKHIFDRSGIRIDFSLDLVTESLESRAPLPQAAVTLFDEEIAGEGRSSKIARIREYLANAGNGALLISALDAIAWSLNLRGSDVPYNPVFTSFLFISHNDVCLFIDKSKINSSVRDVLTKDGIRIVAYDDLLSFLKSCPEGMRLQIDPAWASMALFETIPGSLCPVWDENPVLLMKACKNPAEIEGFRKSMELDAVALVRFFIWLEESMSQGSVTEDEAARQLSRFRAVSDKCYQDSFACIAASGANGAMNHYDPLKTPGHEISQNAMFLLDSGGQYSCGTTDITRTIHPGSPNDNQKREYTLVLKGHLALGASCFPAGTRGYQLDTLARVPLWQNGLNFGHGTGHGVGFALNVHEGPARISPHPLDVPLLPGMVLSNEPGFYRDGEYGIRIENLIAVKHSGYEGFYEWENLTLFPYEKKLIDFDLLDSDEIKIICDYHKQVRLRVFPYLNNEEKNWLEEKAFIDEAILKLKDF